MRNKKKTPNRVAGTKVAARRGSPLTVGQNMRGVLIATIISFALFGCATVSNMDSRSSAITERGLASLQAAFSDYSHSISGSKHTRSGFGVRAIDGDAVKSVYVGAVHELTPGKHSIEILATRQRGGFTSIPSDSTVATVEFTAEAGVRYQVTGKIDDQHAEVWVSEIPTGRVVSTLAKGALATSETEVTPVIIVPK